jgi:hypothetical protein
MGFFKIKESGAKYHADGNADEWALVNASDEQLERWSKDPDCIEKDKCAAYFAQRLATRASNEAALREKMRAALAAKRAELQDNPFDPRTEVSADARHIARKVVMHLWILFVALPLVLAILLSILKQ